MCVDGLPGSQVRTLFGSALPLSAAVNPLRVRPSAPFPQKPYQQTFSEQLSSAVRSNNTLDLILSCQDLQLTAPHGQEWLALNVV